ncbi:MAG: hypothetical protein AAF772_01725 [Acidobacteriota bacterium]
MPTRIAWLCSAEIADGPKVKAGASAEVNAYALVEGQVPAAAAPADGGAPGTLTLELQPSDDAADLRAFTLTASRYAPSLTWTVRTADGTAGAENVPLDAGVFLFGGPLGALLRVAPQEIVFTNTGDQPVDVHVLIGRVTGS